ncbi:hypothetical protein ACFCXR_05380 [Streptomyces noursei]|uniref:hypothetical protein n=1 Tax=Streptomyces noursei TaxID=1971 RepID=UPI0035E13C64
MVALRLLVPDPAVHTAAQVMVVATCDMVDAATGIEALTAAQDTARAAHDRFVDAAAAYFSAGGVPTALRSSVSDALRAAAARRDWFQPAYGTGVLAGQPGRTGSLRRVPPPAGERPSAARWAGRCPVVSR